MARQEADERQKTNLDAMSHAELKEKIFGMTGKRPRYASADQLRDIIGTLQQEMEVEDDAFMGKKDYTVIAKR